MEWKRVPFHTVKERRALIGKTIRYAKSRRHFHPPKDGDGVGRVREISGRNIGLDHDWIWVPDLEWVEVEIEDGAEE